MVLEFRPAIPAADASQYDERPRLHGDFREHERLFPDHRDVIAGSGENADSKMVVART